MDKVVSSALARVFGTRRNTDAAPSKGDDESPPLIDDWIMEEGNSFYNNIKMDEDDVEDDDGPEGNVSHNAAALWRRLRVGRNEVMLRMLAPKPHSSLADYLDGTEGSDTVIKEEEEEEYEEGGGGEGCSSLQAIRSDGSKIETLLSKMRRSAFGHTSKSGVCSPGRRFALNRSSSFQRSLREFELREQSVYDMIGDGRVHVKHLVGEAPPVANQGDPKLYTFDNQLSRSKIKRNEDFRAEVRKLWSTLVGDDVEEEEDALDKATYSRLFERACAFVNPDCPPPDELTRQIHADWAHDLALAKKPPLEKSQILVPPNESPRVGLNFGIFFASVFEFVDTWTLTTDLDEYIQLVRRLIELSADADNGSSGKGSSRSILRPLSAMNVRRRMTTAESAAAGPRGPEKGARSSRGRRKEERGAKSQSSKKEQSACPKSVVIMPPAVVNKLIAKIYQAKLVADQFATIADFTPIRFDRFVKKYFVLLFGTKESARRHLRHFLSSARLLALEAGVGPSLGSVAYPRIVTFCVLSGISEDGDDFNPRLTDSYFFPALRLLFPDARLVAKSLDPAPSGGGHDPAATAERSVLESATIPATLTYVLGGDVLISGFKKKLRGMAVRSSSSQNQYRRPGTKKGGRQVPIDKAILLALGLWKFSDGSRAIREKCAFRVLKRFFSRRRGEEPLPSDSGPLNPTGLPSMATIVSTAQLMRSFLEQPAPQPPPGVPSSLPSRHLPLEKKCFPANGQLVAEEGALGELSLPLGPTENPGGGDGASASSPSPSAAAMPPTSPCPRDKGQAAAAAAAAAGETNFILGWDKF
eukprot:CAMPEP_0172654282 /NCGR_PEP_ID=MMETSP1068-20121228/244250_1 /TAXON_ID=35684 /ORGANISM="Pseudopedinella elastica, Strain CCMP716" /LENGTH=812 /DNA_ID=CAMNT_0013468723 /DNA_START=345 /DNA_END=2783 /DNA_ORIENTATION=-